MTEYTKGGRSMCNNITLKQKGQTDDLLAFVASRGKNSTLSPPTFMRQLKHFHFSQ